MLKFYSIIIGENPKYTATFQPASKRKIALYANCIFVPVTLWFINGFLLVRNVLEGSVSSAICTGLIAAFIIFIIERMVVMSNGSKTIAVFRVLLGFIVASLGSISMDEVIFKNDIDKQVAEFKTMETDEAAKKVNASYDTQIGLQQSIVSTKYNNWQKSLDDVNNELKGLSGGSGRKGKGEIAEENIKIASKNEADYNLESKKLDELKKLHIVEKNKAIETINNGFKGNGFLIRIRAMFELIGKDPFMMGVYILFTAFLFLIEFLVVIIKLSSKKSVDEELEISRNELIRAKTKAIVERNKSYYDSNQNTPSVKIANEILRSYNSSILN